MGIALGRANNIATIIEDKIEDRTACPIDREGIITLKIVF
jgi:hypothetical protein